MTADECHRSLLARLLAPPEYIRVRLVARLREPRLGNADGSRLYVFVPDLHIVSNAQLPQYSYHFNEAENLYRTLFRIGDVSEELARGGGDVSVIQLGDLFDLWRDGSDRPDAIVKDYAPLIEKLYTHHAGLCARVIVGNHDAKMIGAPGWFVRIFLPDEAAGAFGLVTHGDWFDRREYSLPEWLKSVGLRALGGLPHEQCYPIATVQKDLEVDARLANGFRDYIRLREPAPLGRLPELTSGDLPADIPDWFNVSRASDRRTAVHDYLPHAADVVRNLAAHPEASAAWKTIRLFVLGHSHYARISVDDTADPWVAIMDCGAWIEKYVDDRGRHDNCQIGAISGDELRIYQLDPE
jgi:UDP-2,3-diacylglucosamine pyrophosphatase LpxH